jgi:putative transposase
VNRKECDARGHADLPFPNWPDFFQRRFHCSSERRSALLKANAYCERLIGTIRRECLDYLIPINERHLRLILKEFVGHYNRGRPHSALGAGIPEPSQASVPASVHRHRLPAGFRVASEPVLSGLHYEYRLGKEA